jgi:hypothetical protein
MAGDCFDLVLTTSKTKQDGAFSQGKTWGDGMYLQHPTCLWALKHRTSNIEHRTSNAVFAVLHHFIIRQNALLDAGRSTFDVGRSSRSNTKIQVSNADALHAVINGVPDCMGFLSMAAILYWAFGFRYLTFAFTPTPMVPMDNLPTY